MHIALAELISGFPTNFVRVVPDFGATATLNIDNVLIFKFENESRYIWLCRDSGAPRYMECVKHICLFHRDPDEGPAVVEWDKFNNITSMSYWKDGLEISQGLQSKLV